MRSPTEAAAQAETVLSCLELYGCGRWELESCCQACHGGGCAGVTGLLVYTPLEVQVEACCALAARLGSSADCR